MCFSGVGDSGIRRQLEQTESNGLVDVFSFVDDAFISQVEFIFGCAQFLRKFSASASLIFTKLFHATFVELADAYFSHGCRYCARAFVDGDICSTR